MPWKYNGQVVNTSKGFRKTDGYMTPKNWRFPDKKAPDCKKQEEPNKPQPLDRSYITLDQWDSQIGTILPKFTYEEEK